MNLPGDDNRLVIVGATGTGKTVNAVWHLSSRNFHIMPWVVYDFKGDKHINGIPNIRHIDLNEVPVKPGVYVVHPTPDEIDAVENHMWAIWRREKTGVYVDEGLMLGNRNRAYRALLTQGRSKQIPMITLSQRPAWMDLFVFSEAEYYQVFRLQTKKDRAKMEEYIPARLQTPLPRLHSYYYDVAEHELTTWRPVPPIDVIYKTFERRLKPQKPVL